MTRLGADSSKSKQAVNYSYIVTLDDDPMAAKIIEETIGIKNFWFKSSEDLARVAGDLDPMGAFVDIHLDGGDCGLDKVPELRTIWPTTAIIVMTGDDAGDMVAQALSAGADDFIRKPINPAEVLARLKARRDDIYDKSGYTLLSFSDLRVDIKHRSISGPSGRQMLSVREIALLGELIRANGVVVPKPVLKRELWKGLAVSDNALDRKIFEVRKALKEVGSKVEIHSIYGVGMVLRTTSYKDDIVVLDDLEAKIKQAFSEDKLSV